MTAPNCPNKDLFSTALLLSLETHRRERGHKELSWASDAVGLGNEKGLAELLS